MKTYTDPFKLRLQKNISDGLRTITPGNGYVNDLSLVAGVERVFRGRSTFGDDDPLPMVSILEPTTTVEMRDTPSAETAGVGDYELMLQGFVEDADVANPTDAAHVLMADVKQYLVSEKAKLEVAASRRNAFSMGNKVDKIIIGQGTVRPADQVSSRAYFWLVLTISIVEDYATPYD